MITGGAIIDMQDDDAGRDVGVRRGRGEGGYDTRTSREDRWEKMTYFLLVLTKLGSGVEV